MINSENYYNFKVQRHKSSKQIYFHSFVACLGSIYFGYSLSIANLSWNYLFTYVFFDNNDEKKKLYLAIFQALCSLGAAIGSIFSGIIMKYIGRRTIFILFDLLSILTGILYYGFEYNYVLIARFIQGIVVGVNSMLIPRYLREISPINLSGVTGIMNQGFINFGILIGFVVGYYASLQNQDDLAWNIIIFFFPCALSLLRLIFLLFVYRLDTAQYYFQINDKEKAKKVINQTYTKEYQQEIFFMVLEEENYKNESTDTWSLVFSKQYRQRLIIGCLLQVIQQFSGINITVFYSAQLFKNDHIQYIPKIMTIYSGIVLVIFSFLSSILTKQFGRKQIMVVGQSLMIIILLILSIFSLFITLRNSPEYSVDYLQAFFIYFVTLYLITFSLTMGPLVWVYNADILNSEKALGLATFSNWVSASLVAFFVVMLANWHQYLISVIFIFYAFMSFIGLKFIKKHVQETFQKTQKNIIQMFRHSTYYSDENKEQYEQKDLNQNLLIQQQQSERQLYNN